MKKVPTALKGHFTNVDLMEKQIDEALNDFNTGVQLLLKQAPNLNSSTDRNRVDFGLAILVGGFYATYRTILQTNIPNIALGGASLYQSNIESLLSKAGSGLTAYTNAIKGYQADVAKRMWTAQNRYGRTLTDTMKWVEAGEVKTVRNIVAVGVSEGQDSFKIASSLEQYIIPEVKSGYISPLDWARQRFASISLKDVSGIPTGSVSYQAHMIARTESQKWFQQSVIDRNEGQPWTKMNGNGNTLYDWNLSPDHIEEDECDEFADGSPYTAEDLPEDHPNGMCYVTPVLATLQETIDNVE